METAKFKNFVHCKFCSVKKKKKNHKIKFSISSPSTNHGESNVKSSSRFVFLWMKQAQNRWKKPYISKLSKQFFPTFFLSFFLMYGHIWLFEDASLECHSSLFVKHFRYPFCVDLLKTFTVWNNCFLFMFKSFHTCDVQVVKLLSSSRVMRKTFVDFLWVVKRKSLSPCGTVFLHTLCLPSSLFSALTLYLTKPLNKQFMFFPLVCIHFGFHEIFTKTRERRIFPYFLL